MGEKSTIMRFLHQVDSMSFCFISSAEQLTVDISGGKFPEGMRGDVDVWHAVQDVQQGLGQPEKVKVWSLTQFYSIDF